MSKHLINFILSWVPVLRRRKNFTGKNPGLLIVIMILYWATNCYYVLVLKDTVYEMIIWTNISSYIFVAFASLSVLGVFYIVKYLPES